MTRGSIREAPTFWDYSSDFMGADFHIRIWGLDNGFQKERETKPGVFFGSISTVTFSY